MSANSQTRLTLLQLYGQLYLSQTFFLPSSVLYNKTETFIHHICDSWHNSNIILLLPCSAHYEFNVVK